MGIELDDKYFEMARSRIGQANEQISMLDMIGAG